MNQVKEFIEYIINSLKIWVIIQPWETAIRVRFGNKMVILNNGFHFRLPYFDSIYKQENRLRIASMPIQTVTTKDFKTITIDSAIGYSVSNIKLLYETLYHPEITITNIVMAKISKEIYSREIDNISILELEETILESLKKLDYGLTFESFNIKTFAVVKTYRLINDKTWISEGLDVNEKI